MTEMRGLEVIWRNTTGKLHDESALKPERDRCGACGQFLRKDSYYTDRCSDCWTPEDEFWF